mmetsp:Transcript_117883/g.263507  ORF Transcript_117883/g.263507 Transcript_117883/m.263507 type:complete len:250 (+) Transcript_117883:92-841(+)
MQPRRGNPPPKPSQSPASQVPRGLGSLSPELCARMYFSTSSKDSLRDHFSADPVRAAGARATSMKDLLSPPTRWEPSSVPGMQRSMCTYGTEYVEKPLGAVAVNREMGQMFAANSNQGSQKKTGMPLSSVTQVRSTYLPTAAARDPLFRPEVHLSVDQNARLLESKTVFQRDFQGYDSGMQKMGRGVIVKPGGGASHMPKASVFNGESCYQQEFGGPGGARAPAPSRRERSAALRERSARAAQALSGYL